MDMVFKNDQPEAAVPGGSTFNAMISLGRTVPSFAPEAKLYMVTEIGDDHVGDIICDFLKDNNIENDFVTRHENTQTNVSMAFLNERNDAQYEFYKDPSVRILPAEKASELPFEKGDILLFGSFYALNLKLRPYLTAALKAAKAAGVTIYYDINFRKNHLKELPELLPVIEENCRYCDFVRGSDEDFNYLFGLTDPDEVYEQKMSRLCPNIICTCGSKPVRVFSPAARGTYEVRQVKTVSTIGAGDNFNAGFVAGLVKFGVGGATEMTADLWSRLVNNATRYSSKVCESMFNYVDKDFKA